MQIYHFNFEEILNVVKSCGVIGTFANYGVVGGLGRAWLFWFFVALARVSGKTKCAKCVGSKIFPVRWAFYFFLCRGRGVGCVSACRYGSSCHYR